MLLARISLENKPGRVTKLLAQLHGGFHYGENFESCLSGYRECPIWTTLRQAANQSVRCVHLESTLLSLKPRQFRCADPSDKVLVFTDAAFEDGKATWGVVILDLANNKREVSGGVIPQELVDFLAHGGSK